MWSAVVWQKHIWCGCFLHQSSSGSEDSVWCVFSLQSLRMPAVPLRAISCGYGTAGCTCTQLLRLFLGSGSYWRRWGTYSYLTLICVCVLVSKRSLQCFLRSRCLDRKQLHLSLHWSAFRKAFLKMPAKRRTTKLTKLQRRTTERPRRFMCQESKSSMAHKPGLQRYKSYFLQI